MKFDKQLSRFLAKSLLVSTVGSCFGCYAYAMEEKEASFEKTKTSFKLPYDIIKTLCGVKDDKIRYKALEGAEKALNEIYPRPVDARPRGNEIMSTILEYVFCRTVDRRLKEDGKFPEINSDFVYEMRVWLTARDENDLASALASGSGWDKLYPPFIGPALWFLKDQVDKKILWDGYTTFVRNYQKNHAKELAGLKIVILGTNESIQCIKLIG